MAKGLTDLQSQEPIVDPLTGQASPYFLRYLLDRGGFLTSQEQALAKKVDKVIPSTPNTVVKFADASGALKGTTITVRDDNGYVGVGTTTPQQPFVVSLNGAQGIEFGPDTYGSAPGFVAVDRVAGIFIQLAFFAANHKWLIGGTEKMELTATGLAVVDKVTVADDAYSASWDGNFSVPTKNAVYDKIQTLGSSATLVAVRAYNDGAQAIPNNASTAITFNTNAFDSNSVHSTATNPSRFTVPVGLGGKWRISYKVCFAANATGVRISFLRKNGVDDTHNIIGSAVFMPPNGTLNTTNTTTITENLVAGDYVELFIYQTSGGALNVGNAIATDRGFTTTMEMEYLGT
jgi:hypothetical protein